jgi:molybdopterin molybdotransferase
MTQFEKRTPDWLSARDAVKRVLSKAIPLEAETVSIPEALGRALARGVLARASLPPWDNSAMDGYAIRGEDASGATRQAPVTLEVVGETRAGEVAGQALRTGEAIRIMTGAPIPPGADSVIRVEDTDAEGTSGRVKIFADTDVGRHIRPGGQDMHAGEELLPPHTTVGPGQLGLLYASGASTVDVHRRPRVAVLSNGDELAAPGDFQKVLSGRGIPETNSPTLAAELTMAGAVPLRLGIARDNAQDILAKVEEAREGGADALITSGGASMGEMDLFKRVLAEAGFSLDFWRAKIRPGTPFSFGFLTASGEKPLPVFGLPGNPASSFVTYQIFCRPFILRLAGHERVHRPVVMGYAAQDLVSPVHLTHFFRVNLEGDPGHPKAILTGPQTSGLIQSQGLAQGLAVVPEGIEKIPQGTPVRVILLDDMGLGGAEAGYLGD